jgi:GTPase Era involved in 16S rRNA processing
LQLQLFDLPFDLLRLAPELHAAQFRDQQHQVLDLMITREQLLVCCQQQLPQRVRIQRVQIRQRYAHGSHENSVP